MADEETRTRSDDPQPKRRMTAAVRAQGGELPPPPPIEQDDWLPYLETNSAWKFFTQNVDVDYGADTIAVDGLDYRQALRAEHAARIILEIYGYTVAGSIEPLRLVVEEA